MANRCGAETLGVAASSVPSVKLVNSITDVAACSSAILVSSLLNLRTKVLLFKIPVLGHFFGQPLDSC